MILKTATYNIHNGYDVKYDYSILAKDILAEGAARAGSIAQRTLRKVRRKVGLE
jgi:hypothetical protein